MKKASFLVLIILLTFSFVGCSTTPEPNDLTDFVYTIHKDGVAIRKYIGEKKAVVIPKTIEGVPVTSVLFSFMNSDIESIILPDSITFLEENSFSNCEKLHTVVLSKNLQQIRTNSFKNCKNLQNISLPSKLTEIGPYAFSGCESLKEIKIPKTVTKIGMCAFFGTPLTSITFEEGIKNIGAYGAFWCGESLTSVTIPKSVKELGEYTFNDRLKDAYFEGNAPEKIGDLPFGKNTVIHYKKCTSGWDTTELARYELIAE